MVEICSVLDFSLQTKKFRTAVAITPDLLCYFLAKLKNSRVLSHQTFRRVAGLGSRFSVDALPHPNPLPTERAFTISDLLGINATGFAGRETENRRSEGGHTLSRGKRDRVRARQKSNFPTALELSVNYHNDPDDLVNLK
jgi:hypothetical protein